ncbi:MAG TPA: TetR/AcrR family transcriptional regulator [Candidatus Limnocylindrales bacterium]|nr:TetR/AcrR family transcriptional regulator [Candidatus Limnocylindrales bacterium]
MTKSLAQPVAAGTAARGQSTRRRLVEAAIEMVATDGWERVTTRQIAARANVNQALINYHFGSKEELLKAALEVALREEFAAPVRAMLEAPSFVEGAVALLHQLAQMDEAGPLVRYSMEALAQAPRDEEVRRVMAELLAELRDFLATGIVDAQRRGEVSPSVDPRGAAAILGAVFDGLGLHLLIDPSLDIGPAEAAIRGLLTGHAEDS